MDTKTLHGIADAVNGLTVAQIREKYKNIGVEITESKSDVEMGIKFHTMMEGLELLPPTDKRVVQLHKDIQPVLDLYGKSDALVGVYVDNMPNAESGNGNAILFSTGILKRLLNADERKAIAAHEMAHHFFDKMMRKAVDEEDTETMREVEAMCDATAVQAFRELGIDPIVCKNAQVHGSKLTKGQQTKVRNYLSKNGGSDHPDDNERIELVEYMISKGNKKTAKKVKKGG